MAGLFGFIANQKKLRDQAQEIKALRAQVETLSKQNDSMREGMRRCITCEYRIDYKNRADSNP